MLKRPAAKAREMLFGGSVRPCVVPDWVGGLSVHSENIGRTWVQTTKEDGGHQL